MHGSKTCISSSMHRATYNSAGHLGLQNLSRTASLAFSFIGPVKFYKFLYDAEDPSNLYLLASGIRVLQHHDCAFPSVHLLTEAVQHYRGIYGCGCNSLMALVAAWADAFNDCLTADAVPVNVLVNVALKGLRSCKDVIISRAIKLSDMSLLPSMIEPHADVGSELDQTRCTLWDRGLYRSGLVICKANSQTMAPSHERPWASNKTLHSIARGLAHGDPNGMELAMEVYRIQAGRQLSSNECHYPNLNSSCIAVKHSLGQGENESHVVDGYIASVPFENLPTCRKLVGCNVRAIMLSGDLTPQHRHLGFKEMRGVKYVVLHNTSPMLESSQECDEGIRASTTKPSLKMKDDQEWSTSTLSTLVALSVSVLFVEGTVFPSLLLDFFRHGILCVDRMSMGLLHAMSEALSVKVLVYVVQAKESDVFEVSLGFAASSNRRYMKVENTAQHSESENQIDVIIRTARPAVQTVVLCCPVPVKLPALEDAFWACVNRLAWVLKEGKALPGAGITEIMCLRHLDQMSQTLGTVQYSNCQVSYPEQFNSGQHELVHNKMVLHALALGWRRYLAAAVANTGKYNGGAEIEALIERSITSKHNEAIIQCFSHLSTPVFDALTPKLEGWQVALELVMLMLQADAEIVTRVNASR
uniref:Bardet-Biedl syndrome 12 protein homolog isoform X1 n=2 Tax=Myxine glutinosa TaxID=7769 RepID=UPI00358E206D